MQFWPRTEFANCVSALALLPALTGCGTTKPPALGESGARVFGKVLEDGKRVKSLPDETLIITFMSVEPVIDPSALPGMSSPIDPKEGTFSFASPASKSGRLLPGKYRIGVTSQINGGGESSYFPKGKDVEASSLIADVGTESEQSFVVDIGKLTVTKP